jgi:Flp pilus assembly protein TadD
MGRRKSSICPPGIVAMLVLGGGIALVAGCGSFASSGLNSQGVRLFSQNRYQEAMQNFREAIENDPSNADSYYNLAATYHRLGTVNRSPADLSRAEQNYHLCLDRDPNHRECYRGLAVLLVQQNHSEEAFRLLKGWGTQSPTRPEPKIELARLLQEFGDRKAAEQSLIDALAVDDKNTQALAALGRLREEQGDYQQALVSYQRSLTYDRFQSEVAARVAALQSTVGSAAGSAVATGPPRVELPTETVVAGTLAPTASLSAKR